MTEEQRRQAAAKRCADLATASYDLNYAPVHFLKAVGANKAFLNAVLQLDELARKVDGLWTRLPQSLVDAAKPHILPEPKLSPVERLADGWGLSPSVMQTKLDDLGLQLVEKSDD